MDTTNRRLYELCRLLVGQVIAVPGRNQSWELPLRLKVVVQGVDLRDSGVYLRVREVNSGEVFEVSV